ncbi:E3 ubiquitin-protein ligase BRE1-like 2 isoform X2 [Mercurialis annua]|uniref:E3 ubiquitin-protein ligase BRE1-like 2 isoform X2 n=1 Tax=Mercurialis annua TaxID=3986 RepID=UPI00215F59E7|nr:E3 ubiquitin-protein ligase BRE1-like 2 isoform X2 [Mercurialis annua]
MENAESDEPEKKRPHLTTTMARNSSTSPPSNKTVDTAVLQYQNQKLVQQLEKQKQELHDLHSKTQQLNDYQSSYDETLIAVNQLWNQLVDDLILLGVRAGSAGGGEDYLQMLNHSDYNGDEIFLCRLLGVDFIQSSSVRNGIVGSVEEALSSRHSSTMKLMKVLDDTISAQRVKSESIAQALHGNLSTEDWIIQLSRIDDMMKEEVKYIREVMDIIHSKHKEYADEIQTCINSHSKDQSEIKHLAVELEETMAELEESRRRLINLKMQKDAAACLHTMAPSAVNGNLSPEKPTEKSKGLQELKDSIEETKILAADRLSELQDAQEENQILSKELEYLQNELKDDKFVHSSRLYNMVNDQLQHWNAEIERYKTMIEPLQSDRSHVVRREKEVGAKVESADAARNAIDTSESRIEELELQLQKCIIEKNDLEIKMEEAMQDSGRKDIKAEFHVMAAALSKEMGTMEAQLNRWKESAHEALSLRKESQSLRVLLSEKEKEQKSLAGKCAEQTSEIKSLETLIEKLQKDKLELQITLDMYGHESYDSRDLVEIRESERRAQAQAEVLKGALDEHSLELRVKAANEAEAACRQRLSATEAEIAELRVKLDASERDVWEVAEAIKSKDREAEAYISEIETIGQAYEDMRTQHQHLLQQVTKRDDYNIKLVSESVKTKQAQSSLLSDKQALAKQLQQVTTSVEFVKTKISQSEEKMKVCLTGAIRSTEEDRHVAVILETARWELTDAEKELKWLKYAVGSSDKEYEQLQKKIDDIRTELHNERNERKKLDEELKELNDKIDELTSESGEAAILRLQDEIKECKSMLKCSVCSDRPKEVVIVKCYHLFCNPCIQRNLEIRHRKCPGCGTAFGQSDVRFVKI